jgi:multisubunit Na+/H+ antiporter MnhG subunit
MSVGHVASTVLLFVGLVLDLFAVLGMCVMRDTLDRLHYVGLSGYGALCIALAILIRESWSLIGDKSLATAAILLAVGPVLVHTTARSVRIREHGDWREGLDEPPGDGER